MNKIRNQRGFAVLELLLIAIILLGLGGIGWYVVNSNHKTQSQLDNLAKSSSTVPKSSSTSSSTSSNKFVFKELGIQIELPSELSGLDYMVQHFTDGDAYSLTMPSFKSVNEKCYGQKITDAGPSFASIAKASGQFDPNQAVETGLLKQFPNYYISISYPNGITGCDQPGVDEQLVFTEAHKLQNGFVDAFKNTATLVQ